MTDPTRRQLVNEVICRSSGGPPGRGTTGSAYTDHLRRLALNDTTFVEDLVGNSDMAAGQLDAKLLALTRLAALIATGGPVPSYCVETDAALTAGATSAEMVGVLLNVASIVGMPRVVAAAPTLALALGYDTEAALEGVNDPSRPRLFAE